MVGEYNMKEYRENMAQELHRIRYNIQSIISNRRWEFVFRMVVVTGLVTFFVLLGIRQSRVEMNQLQEGIAKEIIRFHVIANSDLDYDQEVKLKVKDAVVTELRSKMKDTNNIREAREQIEGQMNLIRAVATRTLRENGFDYGVSVSLKKETFPIKVYGDVTLPAGEYEALCIRIGEAKGHNWWCIVFPSLCFVDETYSYVPEESKEKLQYVLTDEEYEEITKKDEKKIKVKAKFRLWKYIKKLI